MNRNEQVNSDKMWEYISNVGKAIRKYRTEIGITLLSSLALPFIFSCNIQEDLADIRRESEERRANRLANIDVNVQHYHNHDNLDDGYWRREYEREKSRRFIEQQRLKNARIRANTEKMLRKIELDRKRREAEHAGH